MASFFYLRGTKEEKRIYISITDTRKFKLQKPTPFKINGQDWNQTTQRMIIPDLDQRSATNKAIHNKVRNFNLDLDRYESAISEHLKVLRDEDLLTEKKMVSFIESLNGKKAKVKEIPTDFIDFISYYITSKEWLTDSTKKVYNRTGNLIAKVFPKIKLVDIDDDFKREFSKYMIQNQYQRSYIRKTLKNVRDFWKYAKDKGVKVSTDPETWELTKEFPDIKDQSYTDPYLSLEELERIKNIELPSDYLDNARDWLIVSCWTAQRVSDLMQFSADKIVETNGEKFITIIQKKTRKEITIPLFKEVERVLLKRAGKFPRSISEQKYNEYIKKVCELSGLTQSVHGAKKRQKTIINGRNAYRNEIGYFPKYQLITSHVGRRSFISNFLRQIDIEKIKQMSGHKHTAMVQLYDKMETLTKAEKLMSDFKDAGIE